MLFVCFQGGMFCDERGLGKPATVLALILLHPPETPSCDAPLDEKEWGAIPEQQWVCDG